MTPLLLALMVTLSLYTSQFQVGARPIPGDLEDSIDYDQENDTLLTTPSGKDNEEQGSYLMMMLNQLSGARYNPSPLAIVEVMLIILALSSAACYFWTLWQWKEEKEEKLPQSRSMEQC